MGDESKALRRAVRRGVPLRVLLVGCTKKKRDEPAAARDLYDPSALFRGRRDYAESVGLPWGIVSAKYGVRAPLETLEPYDLTMREAARNPKGLGHCAAAASAISWPGTSERARCARW